MRVLCVEDEALISLDACDMLGALGHQTYDVSDAEEALSAVSEGERFDAMLVDIALPDRSGIELASDVRALQPKIIVVFTTGYPQGDPRVLEALKFGPVVFKPYTQDKLRAAFKEAQGRS